MDHHDFLPEDAKIARRVLVVDDEVLCRELASDILTLTGSDVELAANGAEAMALINRNAFDLVLIDYHMPVMDGITTMLRIREQFTADDLPIIVVSGHITSRMVGSCVDAQVNGMIPKPYTPGEMLSKINRVLRGEMLKKGRGTTGVYRRSFVGS